MKLTQHMLAMMWREAGIEDGDMVLIHSSLRRTLANSDSLNASDVLNSFLEAVGPYGTLVLPLFNFGFTTGKTFDILHTPSEMGALTEAARKHPLAVRTGHPIYSFAFIGANTPTINNFSGYGQDSPFGYLHRNDGKIAILDLDDKQSMTFYHYVEECLQASYRYHKTFTAPYIDATGYNDTRTYSLFVRADGVVSEVNPMGGQLFMQNLYTGCRPYEGCGLRAVKAKDCFDATAKVIVNGRARGMLYEIRR